jgi:MEMO1 family protein
MKMRACAVAGMFYTQDPPHLEQLLEKFFQAGKASGDSKGIVSPHAGYIYSGAVAGSAFSTISPDFSGTFVVIGPSHRGYLTCVSKVPWETPIGVVENDTEFVDALDIEVDESSHQNEHSLEVQMPFIRYRFPRARIAPILMGQQDYSSARGLAEKIVAAVRRTNRDVRIVASSDFSHYVQEQIAKDNDHYAIEPLTRLDVEEFFRRVAERDITICGYGPIGAMALACKKMGAKEARLVKYATSGDVTGDRREVVGYAAIAVI